MTTIQAWEVGHVLLASFLAPIGAVVFIVSLLKGLHIRSREAVNLFPVWALFPFVNLVYAVYLG
ncbi:MAG: hypothetical protein AAF531_24015, partial [Actinomycetota bacterium]